jgi:hypothetical protein
MLQVSLKINVSDFSADDTKTENCLAKHGLLWTFAPVHSPMHFLDEHFVESVL